VQVVEHLYRWSNWEIVEHNVDYDKSNAQTIEFPVTVAGDGTKTISYTVEYTW
jgi:hypothetical protein